LRIRKFIENSILPATAQRFENEEGQANDIHSPSPEEANNMTQPELQYYCPQCLEKSLFWFLFWNEHTLLYQCLNPGCRRRFAGGLTGELVEITESALNGRKPQVESTPSIASGTRKKPWRYLVPLLMLSLLLIATIVGFFMYYLQSSATTSRDQDNIQSLQSQKSQLDSQLALLKPQVDSLNNQIPPLKDQITSLSKQLSDARGQMGSAQSTITGLQSTVSQLQAELKLYHDTGITVSSGVQPLYRTAHGPVSITNNVLAHNPTWSELKSFILADTTDSNYYDPLSYTCGDYAQDVHNHAEAAGIRAAYVEVDLTFQATLVYHALNAFVTTDQGLIYIDCTGIERGYAGPSNNDKTVSVKPGTEYIPQLIVPQGGWYCTSSGIVTTVAMYW